jgi:hypothetical protein
MQHQAALGGGSSAATDPQTIMEEELERKIVENGELHSKVTTTIFGGFFKIIWV